MVFPYCIRFGKLGERKSLPAANGGLSLQEPPSHRVITPGNISATISMGSTSHQHGRSEYRNRRPHHHHHHQPGSKIKARISNLPIAIPAHVRFAEVGMDCSLPYATYSYKGAACNIVTMLTNADSLSPFEISSLSLSLSLCSSRGAPHGAYTGRIQGASSEVLLASSGNGDVPSLHEVIFK